MSVSSVQMAGTVNEMPIFEAETLFRGSDALEFCLMR